MRHVYFMRPVDKAGPIKIGCAIDPVKRMAFVACARREKLLLLAFAPGGFANERSLHVQLAADRVEREWFNPTDAVMAVVNHVIKTGELPSPINEDCVDLMKQLYMSGKTLQEIGDQVGFSKLRVRSQLIQNGCPIILLGERRHPGRAAKVVSLYREGVPVPEIARRVGLRHETSVDRYLQKAGEPRNRYRRKSDTDAAASKVMAA